MEKVYQYPSSSFFYKYYIVKNNIDEFYILRKDIFGNESYLVHKRLFSKKYFKNKKKIIKESQLQILDRSYSKETAIYVLERKLNSYEYEVLYSIKNYTIIKFKYQYYNSNKLFVVLDVKKNKFIINQTNDIYKDSIFFVLKKNCEILVDKLVSL